MRNMLLAPFIRALNAAGWTLEFDSVAGGGRTVQFKKFYGQRQIEVQLNDGLSPLLRATHMLYSDKAKLRGRMSTSPTTFSDLASMWRAIEHERTRTDHPTKG